MLPFACGCGGDPVKIVTIVPCRETSKRLPEKHLQPLLGGLSLLEVLALRFSGFPGDRVIACPRGSTKLEALTEKLRWEFYAPEVGEDDVAHRVMQVVAGYDVVVLANGDSPFLHSDMALEGLSWIQKGADFWGNVGPSGFRLKIFKPLFLYDAQKWDEPEHVLNSFAVPEGSVAVMSCLSGSTLKFSIDTPEDLEFSKKLLDKVGLRATPEEVIRAGEKLSDTLGRRTNNRTGVFEGDPGLHTGPGQRGKR